MCCSIHSLNQYLILKHIFVSKLRLITCALCSLPYFIAVKICPSSTILMCHMALSCYYKQREVGTCRPVERGSSHSCHQIVSISMSELFLTWLPLWSSCSPQREKTHKDRLSQNWTQTLSLTWRERWRWVRTLGTHSLLHLSPPYQRQNMTNFWWVEKINAFTARSHFALFFEHMCNWSEELHLSAATGHLLLLLLPYLYYYTTTWLHFRRKHCTFLTPIHLYDSCSYSSY